MAKPDDIYAVIEEFGQSYKLPGRWSSLPCHKAFFQAPADLLAQLLTRFGEPDLLTAEVLVRGPDGQTALSPLLRQQNRPIMAIRRAATERPAYLVADGRVLGTKTVGALAVLLDFRMVELARQSGGSVFVAANMDDLVILWSCGLPAILHQGLDRIDRKCAAWLENKFLEIQDKCKLAPSFILVNWLVSAFEHADQAFVPSVNAHLRKLNNCIDWELHFDTWKPTVEELDQLEFSVRNDFHNLLHDNLLASSVNDAREEEDTGYAPAMKAALRCKPGQSDRFRRKESQEALAAAQDRQLIAPLLQLADKTNDPLIRNILALLAHVSRYTHTAWTDLLMALQRGPVPSGPGPFPLTNHEDEIKGLLALTDRIMALTKGVRECKRKKHKKK